MLKLIVVFIALAVLAAPADPRAQELRDADDVLWLLDRDRRNLSGEYQRILSRGDLVWVVRISHFWLGVTQEMWIGSASGEVRAMLPVDER